MIYTYAGKDATDVFAGFHSPASWQLLKPLCVGELLVRRELDSLRLWPQHDAHSFLACCFPLRLLLHVAICGVQEEPLSPLQQDFRALRRQMLQRGESLVLLRRNSLPHMVGGAAAVFAPMHGSRLAKSPLSNPMCTFGSGHATLSHSPAATHLLLVCVAQACSAAARCTTSGRQAAHLPS